MTDLKMIAGVVLLAVVVMMVALFLPESKNSATQGLPWQIEQIDDTTRVFGLMLGKSTLQDAETLFLGDSEISLFRSANGTHSVEAYFDKVELGGLTSKMILVMDIPAEESAKMYERGVRISKVGSGSNKISIATEDLHRTRSAAIASITYLPAINLDEKQLTSRFGTPAQRITDPESKAEHWLYPLLGLDVTLDEKEKEVLQYVKPSEFWKISQPLAKPAP